MSSMFTDSRATTILHDNMMNVLKVGNKYLGFDLDKIFSHIDDDYLTYQAECSMQTEKMLRDMASGRKLSDVREDLTRASSLFDNLWAIRNGNMFSIDIDKALKLPMIEDLSTIDLDSIADCYINFTGNNNGKRQNTLMYMSFLKGTEPLSTSRHANMSTYGIVVGLANNNHIDYQVHFTKELFPRFIKLSEPERCAGCTNDVKIEVAFNRIDDGSMESNKICLLGKNMRYKCYTFKHVINPQVAINIIAYIAEMFSNRHRLVRKNSRLIKNYSTDIGVVCKNKDNATEDVPLLQYTKGEGNIYTTRSGIKHSSHASPRQHIRHEHVRHYKSGKTVVIKDITISKGKEKTVYKV